MINSLYLFLAAAGLGLCLLVWTKIYVERLRNLLIAVVVLATWGTGYCLGVRAPAQQRLAAIARAESEARAKAEAAALLRATYRGGLTVVTSMAGAKVCVDGTEIGVTFGGDRPSVSLLRGMKLGRHRVTVQLRDYDDWSGEAEVTGANTIAQLYVELVRSAGSVTIAGLNGAEVWAGGRLVGTLPLTLRNVPTGSISYVVKSRGYAAQEVAGEVVGNGELKLMADLHPWSGPVEKENWSVPVLGLAMVWIAPGRVMSGLEVSKGPEIEIEESKGFWLGQCEVTQREWRLLMGSNPCKFKGESLPVESISWSDAMAFCRKLTEQERQAGRLPTDFEYTLPYGWEWGYACRAGTSGSFSGSGILDKMGWYELNSKGRTHPVKQKQANAWGLYDMHGNVAEWGLNLRGYQSSGTYREAYGGNWNVSAANCTSDNSASYLPEVHLADVGLRVALSYRSK